MKIGAGFAGKVVWFAGALAAMGAVVMLLWNAVVPALFTGTTHQIDYWHALGLLVLCRLLVGGFRPHAGWHGRHHGGPWGHWDKWEKLQSMTPEEREQFLQRGPWGQRRK